MRPGPAVTTSGGGQRARWFRGATTAFWAVTDQALFALSNFGLSVLLARWLTPDDYGAFTVAFSIFLLVGTPHGSLLIEPLMVFGSGRFAQRFRSYLRALLRGHAAVVAVTSSLLLLVAGGTALAGASRQVTHALVALAVATPFVLFQWLMRRACYVRSRVPDAAIAGAMYMVQLFAGAVLLSGAGALSAPAAFLLMGAASLTSGVWLRYRLRGGPAAGEVSVRDLARVHWEYGRWSLPTGAMWWVPGHALVLVLPIVGTLGAAGEMRAALNFVLPLWQANTALVNVLVPALVRARGSARWRSLLRLSNGGLLGMATAYWVVLAVAGPWVSELLYGGQYTFTRGFLLLLGATLVTETVQVASSAALNAVERPDRVFWAQLAAVVVTVTLGLALTWAFLVVGAVTGMVLAGVARGVLLVFFVRRDARGEHKPVAAA
jgi:O-antigen/teichoic acid export membrane protein